MTRIICGVDVSAQALDARIGRDGPSLRVANNAEGSAELAAFCRRHQAALVVMEATGGYEKLAFLLLWQEEMACALANPRAVRRFAEAMGLLEKTDRIDAGVIAWYGETKRMVPTPPPSADQQQLTARVRRLAQLTRLKVAQTNQRRLQTDPIVLATVDDLLAVVNSQIRRLEQAIAELIAADPLWQAFDQTFRQIKGVADRTVARLMADLPEIGTLSNKAVTKLVGYAPLANDSGKARNRRHIRGGRSSVREILFIVAEIVRRHDPDFAAFHKRLTDAGKEKKVVRAAVARKLLVRLNAKARDVRKNFPIPT